MANWPQHVADLLGMKAVVTGFGGQGLTSPGTSGAPPAIDSFHFVHEGAPGKPRTRPCVVVIYQGTNDGVEPAEFEGVYADLLACVRSTYPAATIFAVCPHTTAIYAAAIGNAVAAQHDRGISFLDFSAGVIDAADTCDGCHLNPGGAVACRLATDIAERLRG